MTWARSHFFIFIIVAVSVAVIVFFLSRNSDIQEVVATKFVSVEQFGPLKIGGNIISGPGDWTFAPYMEIPAAKFYASVVNDTFWCSNDHCGLDGAFIQTMGGWLQADSLRNDPELPSMSGLDLAENKSITSIVLIGDQEGKIAGIYLNKGLTDVIDILKQHQDLADFSFLNGINKFGSLKVGGLAPLKPGDQLPSLSHELSKLSGDFVTKVPVGRDFYMYALQKRKYDSVGIYEKYANKYVCLPGGCRYPEPDPPHDFLFANIEELNGWFLANDIENQEMIKMFGMQPEEVLRGKSSLVVVTDNKGIILALHPDKTLSDTFTILSQIPQVTRTAAWR